MESKTTHKSHSNVIYTIVFITLAVITGVEIFLSSSSLEITPALRNTFFILFSLGKAALVAAFFMHLRSDSKFYTYIFLGPIVMLIIFAYVMVIS